ncbi:FeoA family protein [Brachymonas sp. G13]|uniref:FeoA family protein n=1 Tax=Brachymonas TaxID=28219 RepID=UPI0016B1D763|nr:FeoA family protein [Brachymonas sp. J145]MEE1652672.1 FeoA family protein [Brachymonas sp. J145]NLX15516.1 ferrous iron transport protein A [Ramlibacter sp.]
MSSSPEPDLPLSELTTGRWATVRGVLPDAQGREDELMLRLMEIGFVPGEQVRITAAGWPGREPLAVRVGHTTFALRRYEAERIRVAAGADDAR